MTFLVFFIQDAVKLPDFVHAMKAELHNEVLTGQSVHDNFWDFVGLQPDLEYKLCIFITFHPIHALSAANMVI
jgi:catalase